MADTKLSALSTFTPIVGDYVYGVDDPTGTPISGALTLSSIMTLYEAQISLGTARITSGTFADARIAESNVTQHQAALSITESQISDLGTYLTDITGEALSTLSDVTITAIGTGELLKWNGSAWVNNTLAEAGIQAAGSYITELSEDPSPQLGADLDVNGSNIVSTANASISILPNGTGNVVLGNFEIDADQTLGAGTDNYVLTYDNASGTWSAEATGAGSLSNVVEDTTPQLGGDLDVNGSNIVSTANADISILPNGTGNVVLGNYTINADATVGAGQDNYVLTYDNASGTWGPEAAPGAGGGLSNIVEDTTPQLGGMLDVNTFAIGDGTLELLTFTEDASAVNHVNIENEATGSGPIISAAGDDASVDLNISGKGSGLVNIGSDVTIGSTDVILARDAANILAQRNSTTAQELRVYNTYTDASNYELATLGWATNVLVLGSESAGTGSARAVSVVYDGTEKINVATNVSIPSGDLSVTNDIDLGGSVIDNVYTISDGAAFEVDPANGQMQIIVLGANRTPKATNFVAGQSVTLHVDDGTAYTLTWTDTTWGTSGVTWVGGTAPTLATTGYSVITFWKVGSQVYGSHTGDVA
jgi:hypothetical protein